MITLLLAAIAVCIVLSGFFSASEMSFTACNTVRLENLREEGSRRAGYAFFITEHFDQALSAILIGNNLVNIAASSMASVLMLLIPAVESKGWLATVVITILVIIFGETIPKIAAKKNANSLALKFSPWIRFLMVLLAPLVWLTVVIVKLLTPKTESAPEDTEDAVEELQAIIETAEDEAVLDEDRSELLQAAIDFQSTSASEAMTARVDIVAIDVEDSLPEIRRIARESNYSRIPVYEGSIDNIIGILTLNHFLRILTEETDPDIRTLLLKPCFVYKTTPLPTVLSTMRKSRQHLAIVTDEYGGTFGLITMEDVLEQIVGDIWDETDTVEDEVNTRDDGSFEIDGDMSISDFAETFGVDIGDAESETAGGLALELFGRFPEAGESIGFERLTLTVLEMDGHRVSRLQVTAAETD